MKLCFATNNEGKVNEIRKLLGEEIELLSLKDIGCTEELPETGVTLEENSRQKAAYVYEKYQVNSFADDTGLEVAALDGAPGVYSARYAGPECLAENNMNLLLENLKDKDNRRAAFKTCITLVLDGEYRQFFGTVEGEIIREKKGAMGFGYDPIFRPEGLEVTFAEMTIEEKNKMSHRARAVVKLVEYLKR
ncbi:MAG TPA: non-canonical purine NTP diphosphatase [Cytophagaceae bacterium]|jgi:XTP/dITP diphosphohydrolase